MILQCKRIGKSIVWILFICLAAAFAANAQRSKLVEGGVVAGVPYAGSDFENINLTNGSVNLNFPLPSLQGRGSAGFGYSLSYNSKLWNTEATEVQDLFWTPNPTYQNYLSLKPDGGWSDLGRFQLEIIDRMNGIDTPLGNRCELATRYMLAYKWKVEMKFPDGRKVEFRPSGYSDVPPGGLNDDGGYFNVTPNGSIYGVTGSTSNCTHTISPPSSSRMTYYSVDGSGMRLTFANGEQLGFDWEISIPDGSKIRLLPNGVQRILDKNGNWVQTATITLPDSTTAPGWEDEMGRWIAQKRGYTATQDRYYQKGFNGALLTWKVNWKDIFVRKNYTTTCNVGCGSQRGPVRDEQAQTDLRVVESIVLPEQLVGGTLQYTFEYYGKDVDDATLSNGWGELKSVTLPTSAKITYGYKTVGPAQESYNLPGESLPRADHVLERAGTVNRKVLDYTEQYDGQTLARQDSWTYAVTRSGSTVTGPDGGQSSQAFFDIVSDRQKGGQVWKETRQDGTIVERLWANNTPAGITYGSPNHLNSFVKTEVVTIPDASGNPSLSKITDFNYDRNGNMLWRSEYDWIPAASSLIQRNMSGHLTGFAGLSPARTTVNSYYNATFEYSSASGSANDYYLSGAPTMRNLPATAEVRTGGPAGTAVSRGEMYYDSVGNPTSAKSWDSFKGNSSQPYSAPLTTSNSVSVSTAYDSYGNPTLTTDANSGQTQITYGAVNGYSGLYPTQTISAYGTSIARTFTAEYDFSTGLVKKATDVDNNVSTETGYDALGRPTLVKAAVQTAAETRTESEYDDVARTIIVRSDLNAAGDKKRVSIRHLDQLGRERLSRTLEDPVSQSAYSESDGIKVQTRYMTVSGTTWAPGYTSQLTSNPYRAATSGNEWTETMGWTRTKTWSNGRKSETESFSGPYLPEPWAYNTSSTGKVTTEIDANRTLVTDQAGKQRISRTNALGQLKDLWEIKNYDADTSYVTFPNTSITYGYQTNYTYDTLNNLTQVSQGVQNRSFSYSSLSRLTSATNPESGTQSYRYNNNGNLTGKTDARGVSSHFDYDQLSRLKRRWHNGSPTSLIHNSPALPTGVASTFEVHYTYDQGTNGKGRLTRAQTGVESRGFWLQYSSNEYEYDKLGRVTFLRQWIGKDNSYFEQFHTYFASGNVNEITYPSGRKVNYTYAPPGWVTKVEGTLGDGILRTYADEMEYTPSGGMLQEKLGTDTPLYHKQQFNSRGQMSDIRLSTQSSAQNAADGDRGAIVNYYGAGATNNGNLTKQEIFIPGSNFFQQNYTYDDLNRLTSVTERLNGSGGDSFNQTFTYDRYGNRSINATATFNAPEPQFDVSTGQNRLYSPGENTAAACADPSTTSRLMCYDAAGNLTRDKHVTNAARMAYDGEGKMHAHNVSDALTDTITYIYDADGKRKQAQKAGTDPSTFVHGPGGELLADASLHKIGKEYVYRNGSLLLTVAPPRGRPLPPPDMRWLITDHLGTPRIVANKTGDLSAIKRHDYLPFGEEIGSTTGGRSTSDGYASPQSDGVRQQFTGYERDSETGLDYAQARYLASVLGRFTSVDPMMASARTPQPQSWNRYIYCWNNPLRYLDPDGMDVLVLDARAQDLLLKTLPTDIRLKVKGALDKGKGMLTKASLKDINSKDENFAALKTLVNAKELTEVATASKGNGVAFFKTTAGAQREKDIQEYMKANPNGSRADAEKLIQAPSEPNGEMSYLGQTFSPNGEDNTPVSPSGNLRAVTTDQTGDASTVSEEEAVVTMGHEVYGHSYYFRIGNKTWKGEGPVMSNIEERTRKNFREGEQRKNNPANLKPTR